MSDNSDENIFGGFFDTESDHVDHDSDLGENIDGITYPNVETELEESNIHNYSENNVPGSENLRLGQLDFNGTFHTITGPIQVTSTPVGSPERNSFKDIVNKFESELKSKSNPDLTSKVNIATSKSKAEPIRSSLRGTEPRFGLLPPVTRLKKNPVKWIYQCIKSKLSY